MVVGSYVHQNIRFKTLFFISERDFIKVLDPGQRCNKKIKSFSKKIVHFEAKLLRTLSFVFHLPCWFLC